jgi:hypothetical protein
MNLLKCILAGLFSVILGLILVVVVLTIVITAPFAHETENVAIDFVSFSRAYHLHFLVVTACLFAFGFSWERRRLRRKPAAKKP